MEAVVTFCKENSDIMNVLFTFVGVVVALLGLIYTIKKHRKDNKKYENTENYFKEEIRRRRRDIREHNKFLESIDKCLDNPIYAIGSIPFIPKIMWISYKIKKLEKEIDELNRQHVLTFGETIT